MLPLFRKTSQDRLALGLGVRELLPGDRLELLDVPREPGGCDPWALADIDDRDDVIRITTEFIMSEQDLLDAGLSDCVDSARWGDFQVPFGFEGVFFGEVLILEPRGFCGAAAGMIGVLGSALGLCVFRLSRGRRR